MEENSLKTLIQFKNKTTREALGQHFKSVYSRRMMRTEPSVASLAKHDIVTIHLEMRRSTPAPPLDPVGGGRSQRALPRVQRWRPRRRRQFAVCPFATGLSCCRPLGGRVFVNRSSVAGKKTQSQFGLAFPGESWK